MTISLDENEVKDAIAKWLEWKANGNVKVSKVDVSCAPDGQVDAFAEVEFCVRESLFQ